MSSLVFLLLILSTWLVVIIPVTQGRDFFLSGETLGPDEFLEFESCIFKMQSDCNLVLYDNGSPKWASQTANQGKNCNLNMQYDGNLVIYDGDGNALWQSGTWGNSGVSICVLDRPGCNALIYGPRQWNSNSNSIASHPRA